MTCAVCPNSYGDGTQHPLGDLWWDDTLGLMSINGAEKSTGFTAITSFTSRNVGVEPNNSLSDLFLRQSGYLGTLNMTDFKKVSDTEWTSHFAHITHFLSRVGYDSNDYGYVTTTRANNTSCTPAEYIPNTGKLLISAMKIGNKMYDVILKKTGSVFTLTKIDRITGTTCQQAEYIPSEGRIKIPKLAFNNKNYKVTLKKISGNDFKIEDISPI